MYRAIPKNIIKTTIKRMLPNSDHLVHGIASSAKTVGFDSFCNCVLTAIYSLAAYVCAYSVNLTIFKIKTGTNEPVTEKPNIISSR